MPLPFGKELDLKLLRLIKDNPTLYNPKHTRYLDYDAREVVWHKIGDALNRPPLEFAAIQCQIQYGDFQEDKHKPGLIENLNEYLPEQYSGSWGAERRILKLHRKHQGLGQVDAKHLYTKTARDMPTYGVTFFLVKEKQKGKKKLVPRLLGINSESILRLDEVTKEILQVWPLTQVMTYHAAKNDTFTLNFGDYSEKEYSVKTNDAHRIREILEGYIDLIRKRLAAPLARDDTEGGVLCQEDVHASRGNVITHTTNAPCKLVEQSFVGPSRIIDYVQGDQSSAQGTQIMTVQQVVITSRGTTEQHAITGEVPMRKDMSLEFVKKLNRMNSNSVKLVTLLTDPTEENIKQARGIIDTMEGYMPDISKGVKEAAAKQTSAEASKKLQDELNELYDYIQGLCRAAKQEHFNAEDVQDPAKRIADLTTQMYFSLDPGNKRRSALVRRSRASFIEDEKIGATLRRASFIAAAATAVGAVDAATHRLDETYEGPQLSDRQLQELETAAVDRMARLNAAVAHYLTADSDPKNIDYTTAISSMNTINELIEELAKDALALSSTTDEQSRQQLLADVRALCDAARRVGMLTGMDDRQKLHDVASSYGAVSGRLIYTIGGRSRRLNVDKENEIIDLSKDVGDVTTLLLMKANELTTAAGSEPAAACVDSAGVACADCARGLLAAAQLTAPSIHEPHCQSALTLAAENLSSSAQRLAATWRPLVEQPDRLHLGDELKDRTLELARALDRLRNAYGSLGGDNEVFPAEGDAESPQRLRFIVSVSSAKGRVAAAQQELEKPPSGPQPTALEAQELETSISQRMAQINAAVASLLQATVDREHPDYETSELAMSTISELMPAVVHDTTTLSSTCADAAARRALLDDMRAWCQGIGGVCASAGPEGEQELERSAETFAKASQKLSFIFSPRANNAREQLLKELSQLAHERAQLMADDTHLMAASVGGASGDRLEQRGRAVGERARVLRTAVQLTSPTLQEPRCQSMLLTSVDSLSSSARELVSECSQLQDSETGCRVLAERLHEQRDGILRHGVVLETHLDCIRRCCSVSDVDSQRLKFVTSSSDAQKRIKDAEEILDTPMDLSVLEEAELNVMQEKLLRDTARVNAAVAALLQAKFDQQSPDYATAEQHLATVTQLIPTIITDTRAMSASCNSDEQQTVADLRAWCDAVRAVCDHSGRDGQDLGDSVDQFANASKKLTFIFGGRKRPAKEEQILQLSQSACDKARQMVSETRVTARAVGGASGARLKEGAERLDGAAEALRTAAQLTASTIHEPQCQSTLVSSADNLSSSARHLVFRTSMLQEPQCRRLGEELLRYQETLDRAVDGIKKACMDDGVKTGPRPPVPTRKSTLLTAVTSKPDHSKSDHQDSKHVVRAVPNDSDARKISKDFLHQLRSEESQNFALPPPVDFADMDKVCSAKKVEENKRLAGIKAEEEKSVAVRKIEEERKLAAKAEEERKLAVKAEEERKLAAKAEEERKLAVKAEEVRILAAKAEEERKLALKAEEQRKLAAKAEEVRKLAAKAEEERKIAANAEEERKLAVKAEEDRKLAAKAEEERKIALKAEEVRMIAAKADQERQLAAKAEEKRKLAAKAEEEKKRVQFVKCVEDAERSIQSAEEELKRVGVTKTAITALNEDQSTAVAKQMEQKLAQAGAAAAILVSANHPDGTDYAIASESTRTLSTLMPQIVKDAALLSDCYNDKSRRLLLDEIRALCDATRRLCAAANDDKLKLNEAAVAFGDKSARLLYIVSTELDPAQEREVISRAKAIGDSASRLALGGAGAAGAEGVGGARAQAICDAGRGCADAAGSLVYTAKLVAPTVQHPECQTTLIRTTHDLSNHLKTFTATWKPLASDPQHAATVRDLSAEAETLERLLSEFKEDLAAGRLVKMKPVEKVEIEDTELRQLVMRILKDAQGRAECVGAEGDTRHQFAEYANKLADAVRLLDRANYRCKQAQHDTVKRKQLENAIQGLQVTLLQARPALGDQPHNYIVDLTDFVKEVSTEAEKLTETANKTKVAEGKKALEGIKQECHRINLSAFRLMSADSQHDDDDSLYEMMEVDQFGQHCEGRIQAIDSLIEEFKDTNAKVTLRGNATALAGSCNMLRFATKSALATSQSVALDETLEDLADLERRVDSMLRPADAGAATGAKAVPPSPPVRSRLVCAALSLSRAAPRGVAPALAAYLTEIRGCSTAASAQERNIMKEHLHKLLDSLKMLTLATGTRVALWQPVQCPEVVAITQQVIRELDKPLPFETDGSANEALKVLNDADINRLLMGNECIKIDGDNKQIETKLQQSAAKLTSMTGTIVLSASKPESLARSAHTTTDAAIQLAAVARAIKTESPVQAKKVEEATQEMCFATYNVLKAAELVSQDPNNSSHRRKLLDACRLLNDAINKLTRTAPNRRASRDCTEFARSLQMQQALLQSNHPSCALPYSHCVDALQNQNDVIQKLNSDEPMSREQFTKSLSYVTAAVCNSTEYASQCAYLIAVASHSPGAGKDGLADVPRIQKLSLSAQECCFRILKTPDVEQAIEEAGALSRLVEELVVVVKEAAARSKGDVKRELTECSFRVDSAAKTLHSAVSDKNASADKISSSTLSLLDALSLVQAAAGRPALTPRVGDMSADVKDMTDGVMDNSKKLLAKTQALVKDVNAADDDEDPMTWVMFNTGRSGVLLAFEELLNIIRRNGQRAGLVELPKTEEVEEETDGPKKSFVQIQVDLANKWLQRKPSKREVQAAGETAARTIIHIAQKMSEELKGHEKDEMHHLTSEAERLVAECSKQYDHDKANALMELLRELRQAVERGVVSRVVEDFIDDAPLADLDVFTDAEKDDSKRKFLLEQKIAELLAQLGRVTRTARFVADARIGSPTASKELNKCSEQTELLAPLLVKAAQDRVASPDDTSVVDRYKALLAQYTESMSRVRDLCDRAVDPMEFVQTAGETMQRMRDESAQHNDPQRCAYTSIAIQRLAGRVIHVGMSSRDARSDPELLQALSAAKLRLSAATPAPGARASRLPDWRDTTAEILRTTGEVESVLGGENIFKKQPEPDQPIYNAALNLHAAVREWSARDNEIVAVAKRMAVLMARLSDFMNTDKKRDLIATSKSIVSESHEVARLAKKLALECNDIRIRTNLLQVCERIPTISGQLKMLTTVKGSSLGRQGSEEDKEAMNTLVGNAQNLMMSVQEVVKAAAGASVKIASQRAVGGGPRMRWVRKHYY